MIIGIRGRGEIPGLLSPSQWCISPKYGLFCYNQPMILQQLIAQFLEFADGLKYRSQFLIILSILILDLLIPDVIPFFDEIILGLVALLLANLKEGRKIQHENKDVIEGEVVESEVVENEDENVKQ